MKIGFKTGPNNWEEGKRIIAEDGAKLCEIWFRIDKAPEYADMLQYMEKEHVAVGLHHWGLIDGTYKTNVASLNAHIREATIQQIKDTIDIGSTLKECAYVNAHCGSQSLETMTFHPHRQLLLAEDHASKEQAEHLFLEACLELHTYAQEKGVLLTIETLPALEYIDSRTNTYNPGNIALEPLKIYANQGGYIANDITHSAGQIALYNNNPAMMWELLLAFTQEIITSTKLLHVNTVIPPFDGTDTHNGILAEDFAANAFPSQEQLKKILTLFAKRNDVYVIPEPKKNMQENYQALTQLAASVVY